MSGGRFDYVHLDARHLAGTIDEVLEWLDAVDDPDEATERLEELQERLDRDADLLHAVEWWASGDVHRDAVEEVLEEDDRDGKGGRS